MDVKERLALMEKANVPDSQMVSVRAGDLRRAVKEAFKDGRSSAFSLKENY